MPSVTDILKEHKAEFAPVVKFRPGIDTLALFDFTKANLELTPDILGNTRSFCAYINLQLENKKALYGIGGYNEHRTVYSISKVFDGKPGEEPRRLHLGTDIWGKPHTTIMAPADGIVHSFACNDRFGDYGSTIILTHHLSGISFHTLYGHLSLNSIKNIQPGDRIRKGDVFADFGIPSENGQWPPHLHLQIIIDIGEWKGDYPGVCKYSEKEQWLTNSPDPDLILQLNKYITA